MNYEGPIRGYDFVKTVLNHPRGEIDELRDVDSFGPIGGQAERVSEIVPKNDQAERKQYCVPDLKDEVTRQEISSVLSAREFDAKLLKDLGRCAFFKSEEFAEDLYCKGHILPFPRPKVGEECSVRVKVVYYPEDEKYVFAVVGVSKRRFCDSDVASAKTAIKETSSNICVNNANLNLYKTLQKMEVATVDSFSKVVPSDWKISFKFLDSHRCVFKKLISLCQSLCGLNVSDERSVVKKQELINLLSKYKEFAWLQKNCF